MCTMIEPTSEITSGQTELYYNNFCVVLTSFVFIYILLQGERKARIHMLRLEKGALKAAEELQKCKFISNRNIYHAL